MARMHRTSVIAKTGHVRRYYAAECWCGWQASDPAQHLAWQRGKAHEAKKNKAR